MKIIAMQSNLEKQLGIPLFSGVKSVAVVRTAGKSAGRQEWLVIRYTAGVATLPRGYRPSLDENGYVITREIGELSIPVSGS